jgi:peroxiredoxin
MPQDQPRPEPTAALTSRTAVVAALLLFAAIVLAVVVLQGCAGEEADDSAAEAAPAGPAREGMAAPDFTLTSLDGEELSLSDYAGRPVLVNFWASWCPPCRDEFPALVRAYETHAADGLEILGVTYNDQPDLAREFVDESGAEWPILSDPDHLAWDAYSPVGPPTSYFIDADGIVQKVHIGAVNDEQLTSYLAAIGL